MTPLDITPGDVRTYFAARVPALKGQGRELRGPCPVHKGKRDSFAVNVETGQACCHSQCGRGWDIVGLERELTGADFKTALAEVQRITGNHNDNGTTRETIVATCDYTDEQGTLLYQCVRFHPKNFRQRRPDGCGGWIWNLGDVRRVLYRLPRIAQAEMVFIVEGEKDVHALESIGLVATCNPMGAGKWRDEYADALRGKRVGVIPDNDGPGRQHAGRVCHSLRGVAADVRLIELPGLPPKGDASDWIRAGGTREALLEMFSMAAAEPTAEPTTDGAAEAITSIEDIPPISACGARPITYAYSPLFAESSVTGITGGSGDGKSSIVLGIAGEIANGGRPVLILDRENPLPVIAERFTRFHLTDGLRLRYWGGWLPDEPPQPAAPIVVDWTSRCEPKPLIVVDSMIAFNGGDENDASATRAFMQQCRMLANLGASVVVIHHTGKSETSQDYRGSSDFKAAVDAAFHISNSSIDGRLGTIRARCFKSRFGFAGELVFHYQDGYFVRDDRANAPALSISEQLTELLRDNPGTKVAEFETLASNKGIPRHRARNFIDNGVKAKSIRIEKGPHNSRHHFLVAPGEPNGDPELAFS